MNVAPQIEPLPPDEGRMKKHGTRTWQTRDLALAAYCLQHGLEVVRAQRRGKEFEFLFRDPDGQGDRLAVGFANSVEARFDSSMRALKKLCHRKGTNGS